MGRNRNYPVTRSPPSLSYAERQGTIGWDVEPLGWLDVGSACGSLRSQ